MPIYEQNVYNVFQKYKIVNRNVSICIWTMNKKYGIIG